MSDAKNAAFSTQTAETFTDEMETADLSCWVFPAMSIFLAAWACFHTSVFAFAWKRTGCWENIAGREAWWGKPGGVLSGIARCKWFHLSHVSQEMLFWVIVGACLHFILWQSGNAVLSAFLSSNEEGMFSFWSCYSSSACAVLKVFFFFIFEFHFHVGK